MICECCKFNNEVELEKATSFPVEFTCEICKAYCVRYVETDYCGFRKKGDVAVEII